MTKKQQTIVSAFALLWAASCGAPEAGSHAVESPANHSASIQEDQTDTPKRKQTETEEPIQAPSPNENPPPSDPGPSAMGKTQSSKTETDEIADANINVGELEADGLLTKNISCKSESSSPMALLGIVLVTAWMAPKKAELYACTEQGSETRVRWRAKNGKVLEIHASGNAKAKACVEKALTSGKPMLDGHCAATIVHGAK